MIDIVALPLHGQLVERLLPLEEIEFTGQSLHAAEPVLCL